MRRFLPIAVFLAVSTASLIMAGTAYFAGEQAARFKFAATADDALARIDARIAQHVALLRAALAFMQATGGQADSAQFQRFVDTLELGRRFTGVRGLGYARLVRTGEEQEVTTQLAGYYGRSVSVWPTETDQDWRTPVTLLSPLDERSLAAIGFDMFGEPSRRAAMQEAMAGGEARATVPIALVQSNSQDSVPGFIVYLPFYNAGAAAASGEEALVPEGFLYASFRINDLFSAALGANPVLPVSYNVFDGTAEENRIVYDSASEPGGYGADYRISRELHVAGRPWTVIFDPTAEFGKPLTALVPLGLGMIGVLLGLAAFLLMRSQQQAYEAAAQLQRTTEKSLQDKDLLLREMNHRIKNSIARVIAIARHTANGSSTIDEFSRSFGARLQAMAASQDMLTRSRWEQADLGELLKVELGQVFGDQLSDDVLSGPAILLSASMTQALGLTFHELATNALKYGNVKDGADTLRVRWSLAPDGTSLQLEWIEKGIAPVRQPDRIGFGTKLIDATIRHELGGTIERVYGDAGLRVHMVLPISAASEEAPKGTR